MHSYEVSQKLDKKVKASQIKITTLKKEIERLGGNTRGRSPSPAKREKTVDEGESKMADGRESKTEDEEEQAPKAATEIPRVDLVDNGVQMELDHVASGASSVAIPDDASDERWKRRWDAGFARNGWRWYARYGRNDGDDGWKRRKNGREGKETVNNSL